MHGKNSSPVLSPVTQNPPQNRTISETPIFSDADKAGFIFYFATNLFAPPTHLW